MGTTKDDLGRAEITDRHLELVRAFPPRTVRTEDELDAAIAVIDGLIARVESLEGDERDDLEALSTFVERYEAANHPIAAPSEADLIVHLMESRDLTVELLAGSTGMDATALGELVEGRARLNRDQIERLAAFFRVDPGIFLGTRPSGI